MDERTVTLRELLAITPWDVVSPSLLRNYPDAEKSLERFRQVFAEILSLSPHHTRTRICLEEVFREGIDDEPFIDVVGRDGTLNKDLPDFHNFGDVSPDFADSETAFAIEMVPWEEWIGMELDPAALKTYDDADIVAHCLWEMTFCGFDQNAIRQEKEELGRRAEELKNMTEEEKKQKLIPWEKVRENLDGLMNESEKTSDA
jgi:hypothetical protein